MSVRPVTVSITTRNRPAALERCLRSLACIAELIDRVIVFDDGSSPHVPSAPLAELGSAIGLTIDLVRADISRGTAAGKNVIANRAQAPYLLSLDDDAFLVGGGAVRDALRVISGDTSIAAIAFAQLDRDGTRLPADAQPSPSTVPCYVPAFIGFACLLDRAHLLQVGGYREAFGIHGEERELCLRWLERGWHVVYLPDAGVAHAADPQNRDVDAYVRLIMRNDCLNALYNDPWPRAAAAVPYKLWSYARMTAGRGGTASGVLWIASEVLRSLPQIRRERRPVRWSTLRSWTRLRNAPQPYATGVPRA